MLTVDQLSVHYGPVRAVKKVSLAVQAGEIVAVLGANGAGKSSILNACLGLAPRSAGSITLDGARIDKLSTEAIVRLGLTLVPEGRRVFSGLTVAQNLSLGASAIGKDRAVALGSLDWIFSLFPRLAERRAQLAGTLSGGEQQMLAIGRALMSKPRLLLLDEPSLGLAPNIVDLIFDLIIGLRKEGFTFLLVEQNAELALDTCDRAYLVMSGAVAAQGTPDLFRQNDLVGHSHFAASG
ncbi:ABC transporter ATP-binding protein [Aestuariivirga sp. YIM B02566]|uniref:ABC transporter ATP-binding protein n=1 Tax=Taklimakanibacter albus TaxID=2800327 RepID=A0ACC5R0A6_9HYPH|nr:ABC transporter ATP-binding protein [Aestuariivirga sp. YIM B02566]MBK1866083.1 ABC transporter ATP-binding protein [Aestuariivirga sp. YIM B02566]